MIWCRFQRGSMVAYGIVEGDTIAVVEGDPFNGYKLASTKLKLQDVKLLVPVIPGTIYAIGSNYHNHVVKRAAVRGGAPKFYKEPRVGYRAINSLIGQDADIVKPYDAGLRFEYEAELVAVIGKPARRVSPEEAENCILGWTIGNDVTERDWQRDDPSNLRSKNADTFSPMGPWMVTGLDLRDMVTNVRLNGKLLHSFPTGNMLFSPGKVISSISQYNTLAPGDVVWLGTDEIPESVKPGDEIEIEITGLGTLRNRVVGEASNGR